MSTPDEVTTAQKTRVKIKRGVFTLVVLVLAAAAGGCYFALTLK